MKLTTSEQLWKSKGTFTVKCKGNVIYIFFFPSKYAISRWTSLILSVTQKIPRLNNAFVQVKAFFTFSELCCIIGNKRKHLHQCIMFKMKIQLFQNHERKHLRGRIGHSLPWHSNDVPRVVAGKTSWNIWR